MFKIQQFSSQSVWNFFYPQLWCWIFQLLMHTFPETNKNLLRGILIPVYYLYNRQSHLFFFFSFFFPSDAVNTTWKISVQLEDSNLNEIQSILKNNNVQNKDMKYHTVQLLINIFYANMTALLTNGNRERAQNIRIDIGASISNKRRIESIILHPRRRETAHPIPHFKECG